MSARHSLFGFLVAVGLVAGYPAVGFGFDVPAPPSQSSSAQARKQVVDAQAALEKAKADLALVKRKIAGPFEAKPEYQKAKEDAAKANSAFETVRKALVDQVHGSAAYKDAVNKRQSADDKLQKLQAAKNPDQAEIEAASKEIAVQGDLVNRMQREAEDSDPAVSDAKVKKDEADKVLKEMLAQEEELVKGDADCQLALQAVATAEQQVKSAKEQMAAAMKADRDAALAKAKAAADARASSSAGSGSGSGKGPRPKH